MRIVCALYAQHAYGDTKNMRNRAYLALFEEPNKTSALPRFSQRG